MSIRRGRLARDSFSLTWLGLFIFGTRFVLQKIGFGSAFGLLTATLGLYEVQIGQRLVELTPKTRFVAADEVQRWSTVSQGLVCHGETRGVIHERPLFCEVRVLL